jgi:hypothetical protein
MIWRDSETKSSPVDIFHKSTFCNSHFSQALQPTILLFTRWNASTTTYGSFRVLYITNSRHSPAEIVGSNPTGDMDVCCEYFVLSGRGLCDELITRPEESYRLWCVTVCDLEKPQEWRDHGPRWVAAPQKKKITTLKQQNAQNCSLDIYFTISHWYKYLTPRTPITLCGNSALFKIAEQF